MSHGPLSRAVDAGRVLGALRDTGIVGPELRSLSLERAWPWRQTGLCALYSDRLAPPGHRGWTVLQAAAGGLPSRLRRAAAKGSLHWLPAVHAFVMPPAGDPELPILELLDGHQAASRLHRWLGAGSAGNPLRAESRGYKPLRRLTVEYASADGAHRLFGKALRSRDLSRVEAACANLAGSPAADRLALPLDVVRRWSMLLFEPRPGTALDRLIPGPAARRGVALAGEALALFHGGWSPLPASHSRRRETETLDRWLGCTGAACPEMADRLRAVRQSLDRLGEQIPIGMPVPSHRDYHPGQLLVAPPGATILDLDTAAMAEPELDAGNFLAHLDLLQIDRSSVPGGELAAVFRSAYERCAGRPLDGRRLLWYRVCAVLRLACVYRFRPRGAVLGTLLTRRCLALLAPAASSLEVI